MRINSKEKARLSEDIKQEKYKFGDKLTEWIGVVKKQNAEYRRKGA